MTKAYHAAGGIDRQCYERQSGAVELPIGIDLIGRYYSRGATLLPRHRHAGGFELCYIEQGSMRYRLAEHTVEIQPGEVHICRPGEEHAGENNRLSPCLLYWVEADPAALLERGEALAVFDTLRSGKLRLRRNFFVPAVERMLEECGAMRPERWQYVRNLMRLLLIDVAREWRDATAAATATPIGPQFSEPVRRVIAAMRRAIFEPVPLAALLAGSGLKSSSLYERFRRETGFSPNEYWLRLKIEQSLELLQRRQLSITAISCRLHFCSSQYFAAVFRKITGYSPRQWRDRS